MDHFIKQFQLKDFLAEGLERLRIVEPTPIQLRVIPEILKGKHVIGHSQTGTGKTMAYLLPILQQVEPAKSELQAIILAPTRELTQQINDTISGLTKGTAIDFLSIRGGIDINRQIQQLKRNPHIITGTPGRILDLIDQGKLASHQAGFLVIDEADMMLEMGFVEDIEKILKKMKKRVQIMLFAATLPQKVMGIVKKFMQEPSYIEVDPGEATTAAIENLVFKVRGGGKEAALISLIRLYNPFLGMVFVTKKEHVDGLVTELRQAGIKAEPFHGDMGRGQRKQVIQNFRQAKSQILVATDIASRGLDIEGVTHIFNFELPINVEQYIHRIGRTGRAGEKGIAINIIISSEEDRLRQIESKIRRPFKNMIIKEGEVVETRVGRKNDGGDEKPRRKLPSKVKKYTGPNSKKKAVKEAQKMSKASKLNQQRKRSTTIKGGR